MLMLSAPEGAYANAALFIALVRKLIDKGVISKEEMSRIVDEAGTLLSKGNPVAMRQALQTLRWFRQDIGIEGQTTEGQEHRSFGRVVFICVLIALLLIP